MKKNKSIQHKDEHTGSRWKQINKTNYEARITEINDANKGRMKLRMSCDGGIKHLSVLKQASTY